MKRIANHVAVTTICYALNPNQNIAIYDYPNEWNRVYRTNGTLVADGKVKDIAYDFRFSKYFESKCYGIEIEDGTVVFDICTRYEEYK